MRYFPFFLQTMMILIMCQGCSKAQTGHATHQKVLVVYLSRTGNTKVIAEMIHHTLGGTITEIETATPYPTNYQATVQQVGKENETGYLPPLKTRIDSMDTYDVVFVGFPTWGMQLPPPVKSFLSANDLVGKKVIPFNTNAGYGVGSSFDKVRELCPESDVLEGFSIRGGVERDGQLLVMVGDRAEEAGALVQNWLRKINMIL